MFLFFILKKVHENKIKNKPKAWNVVKQQTFCKFTWSENNIYIHICTYIMMPNFAKFLIVYLSFPILIKFSEVMEM